EPEGHGRGVLDRRARGSVRAASRQRGARDPPDRSAPDLERRAAARGVAPGARPLRRRARRTLVGGAAPDLPPTADQARAAAPPAAARGARRPYPAVQLSPPLRRGRIVAAQGGAAAR